MKSRIIPIIMLILGFLLIFLSLKLDLRNVREEIRSLKNLRDYIYLGKVTAYAYNAEETQTDLTPNLTASGYKLTPEVSCQIVAISRDLEKYLEFGNYIFIPELGNEGLFFRVEDLMAKNYKRSIDIFMNDYEMAKRFGKRKLSLFKVSGY